MREGGFQHFWMPLNEYVRKRSFKETPEPRPGANTPASGNSFCVQRHDATRLHYDFRLEIDGTLKSWAVPKGPTLDPTPKRLAAMVEDHPLEYGGFEGNIPKGNYGAGSVMLWDRGTYELLGDKPALEQLARGDLKFKLHGEKLKGEFAIVLMKGRGKGNEWLLLKKKDAEARPGWLASLIEPYRSPDVVGTGGAVLPRWPDTPPRWLPPEFHRSPRRMSRVRWRRRCLEPFRPCWPRSARVRPPATHGSMK